MKNLVRKGVADAAEQTRIRQRPLQRVVLATQCAVEVLQRTIQNFEGMTIEGSQGRLSAHNMNGGALFRSGFRENQRSGIEIECGKPDLSWRRMRFAPLKPTGNHEMDDQEVAVFK